jgi:hypothetical protein
MKGKISVGKNPKAKIWKVLEQMPNLAIVKDAHDYVIAAYRGVMVNGEYLKGVKFTVKESDVLVEHVIIHGDEVFHFGEAYLKERLISESLEIIRELKVPTEETFQKMEYVQSIWGQR